MKKYFLTILLGMSFCGFGQKLKLNISLSDSIHMNFDSLSYKKNHINAKSISTSLNNYIDKLQHLGYLNSQIIKKNNTTVDFNYTILLNKALEKIIIKATHEQDSLMKIFFPELKIKNESFHLPFSKSENFLDNTKQKLYDLGYTFVQVKLTGINIENKTTAKANLSIKYTNKRTIDEIIIKGYPSFPQNYVKHHLDFPNKKLLNDKTLFDINTSISKLPFISNIKPAALLFTKDSTKLYLYLKKRNNSSFQGILGISANENKKASLYGYLKLKLNNTFNKGESILLDWNKTSSSSQKLILSSTLPYLFKTPISGQVFFKINKIDSSYTNTTSKISFYRAKNKITIGLGYSNLKSKVIITSITNYSNLTQNSIYAYFKYSEKSLERIFSHKSLYSINIQSGKLNTSTLTEKTNEISLFLGKLIKIKDNNYLYISNSTKYSTDIESNTLSNKNDILGGLNNLRGFNENQFLTNTYSLLDIEYRYLLNKNLYTTINSQMGYLELETTKLNTLSFGASLNIKQKNGLLSILYDLGKTNEASFRLTNSKIKIRFLTFF